MSFAKAERIVLVQDDLNTQVPAALYEAFPPEHAPPRRAFRVALHAQQGGWLHMAESELTVLSGHLARRIPDRPALGSEVKAWPDRRNANHANADRRFTAADARIELKSLYPSL